MSELLLPSRGKIVRLQREAPHINGFPVPLEQLDLPQTMLDTDKRESWNNHHMFFYARTLGRLVMTQTMRDMNRYQRQTPKDIHNIYHDRYSPAPLPDLTDVMDVIDEVYQTQEPLRKGSASFPTYSLINEELYRQIQGEYNLLNQ